MRSSDKRKTAAVLLVFLAAAAVLLLLLDTMLYPCTFIRNDIHAVTAEKKDLVILGTSNGKMDLDPEALIGAMDNEDIRSGQNLCVGGEYPVDAYYLTKLMAEKNRPERILFEVDPGYFTTQKEEGNNYLLFYHEFPLSAAKIQYFADAVRSCNIRTLLFPAYEYSLSYELPRIPETFRRKVTGDYDISWFKGQAQEYHENGFVERYPVEEADFPSYEGFTFEGNRENLKRNTDYLEKLIRYCEENGIEFTAAIMPLPEVSLEQDSGQFEMAWEYFGEFFEEQSVKLYNFNTDYYDVWSHDLSHYVDYDGHMNGDSARAFSAVFGSMLRES